MFRSVSSYKDVQVTLKNGEYSEILGTQEHGSQSVLLSTNKFIRYIRVRMYLGCLLTEIQFLDYKKKRISQARAFWGGDTKEYQLEEGEVITGIFGEASYKNFFKTIGFVLSKYSQ